MSSEDTDTLILAFTLKAGKFVACNTHRIFLFGFFCQRENIIMHFIGIFSDSRCKGFSR